MTRLVALTRSTAVRVFALTSVLTLLSAWPLVRHLSAALPADLARYVVEKGSITVDGVSLTVVDVRDDSFSVSLIPTTLAMTTLGFRQPGDAVNLEVDVLAKYVERLMSSGDGA